MKFRKNIPPLAIALLLIFIYSSSSLTFAQEISEQPRPGYFWVNGGLGASTGGLAIGLNLSLQPPQPGFLLFSLRGITNFEILGDDISELAILGGYSSKRPKSRSYFSIATGIGTVSGSSIDATFGVPVEIQLFYQPLRFAGIGLLGFANLNKEENLYGILLCLQFGKLR
jgi:hypothetical protein